MFCFSILEHYFYKENTQLLGKNCRDREDFALKDDVFLPSNFTKPLLYNDIQVWPIFCFLFSQMTFCHDVSFLVASVL